MKTTIDVHNITKLMVRKFLNMVQRVPSNYGVFMMFYVKLLTLWPTMLRRKMPVKVFTVRRIKYVE